MKVISKPRAAGKTYDLIKDHFIGKDTYLLVMSEKERKRIINNFQLDHDHQRRILLWSEKEALKGINKTFILDNVDIFLEQYFNAQIRAVTTNGKA